MPRRHLIPPPSPQYSGDQVIAQAQIPKYRTSRVGFAALDRLAGDRMRKTRVAVLISGRGSNMMALTEAAKKSSYPAEIALVLSNRPDAAGLVHAETAGIRTASIDHTSFGGDRESFERAMHEQLLRRDIELVCLAGFMRLLSSWFVARWEDRILNIHPALLPAFKGLDTHRRALAAGVKIHGATVHFVSAEMDSGPIIAQGAVAVREGDDAETLAERVLEVEHRLYPLALGLVAAGCVRVVCGRCVIDGGLAGGDALIVPDVR
jgi:phosphoribosylglycinamide formyltransferase-1